VADGTVSGRLLLTGHRIRQPVAFHAPPHVVAAPQRILFVENGHILDLSVALLAHGLVGVLRLEAGGSDMPHVREVRVIGDLVDPVPRDAFPAVYVLLDLRDLDLLRSSRALDDLVTSPAGRWFCPGSLPAC
jgi:hypothetical protein